MNMIQLVKCDLQIQSLVLKYSNQIITDRPRQLDSRKEEFNGEEPGPGLSRYQLKFVKFICNYTCFCVQSIRLQLLSSIFQ
jgi:hypothetical protein